MKTKYGLYLLIALMGVVFGCADDSENLTPSDIAEYELKLPQGDHAYDSDIVDFNNRTGIYILYKFSDAEAFYNANGQWPLAYSDTVWFSTTLTLGSLNYVSGDTLYHYNSSAKYEIYPLGEGYTSDGLMYTAVVEDNKATLSRQKVSWSGSVQLEQADENYVGQQLELLEQAFLQHYPDSVLSKYLPLKILLTQNLVKVSTTGKKTVQTYYKNFNNLMFNYGNADIESLTVSKKKTIKEDLNLWFVETYLLPRINLEEFYSVTDYYWAGGTSSQRPKVPACYELGLVAASTSNVLATIQSKDLDTYLDLILNTPYSNLNSASGMLNKGEKIRQKYNILINEFKKLGVDLQNVGNYDFSN